MKIWMNGGACGEMCLYAPMINLAAWVVSEHIQTERGYLLRALGSRLWERDRPQCGKWLPFDTELSISSLLSCVMEKSSPV